MIVENGYTTVEEACIEENERLNLTESKRAQNEDFSKGSSTFELQSETLSSLHEILKEKNSEIKDYQKKYKDIEGNVRDFTVDYSDPRFKRLSDIEKNKKIDDKFIEFVHFRFEEEEKEKLQLQQAA